MYVVLVYDVSVEKVNKIRGFLRRYLNWIQNSVFEGELTVSEYERIKNELLKLIETGDSIIIYRFRTKDEIKKDIIGSEKGKTDIII